MHILLDIDGTLLDTNYLHVDAWARAFHEIGLVIPRAAIHRQMGRGDDQLLPLFVSDPQQAERASELHRQHYARLASFGFPLPGARELLFALRERRHRLWMTTSAQPEEIGKKMELLDVPTSILTGVVSAGDVARSKPAPDLFLLALDRARCRPEDALVLGDTIWDVQAARAAGVRAAAVRTGGAYAADELRAAGAIAVFDDCADLLAHDFLAQLA